MATDDDLKIIVKAFYSNRGYKIDAGVLEGNPAYNELVMNKSIDRSYICKTKTKFIAPSNRPPANCRILVNLTPKFAELYSDFVDRCCSWDVSLFLKILNPIKPLFIKPRFFQSIKEDPQFIVSWNGLRAEIFSSGDETPQYYLKHICLAYDGNEDLPLLSIFLCDFVSMGDVEKGLIRPFLIDYKPRYYVSVQNIINLIDGREFPNEYLPIYDVITYGLKLINHVFNDKYDFTLFKNTEAPDNFRTIFYPTKKNYENFIRTVSVMMIDNLNVKQLRTFVKTHKSEIESSFLGIELRKNNPDLFTDSGINKLGGIKLLNLCIWNLGSRKSVINLLDTIWNIRNKISHSAQDDDYNTKYYDEQDDCLITIHHVLLKLLNNLDWTREISEKEQQYQYYSSQYSKNGCVLCICGFNRPKRITRQ